MYRPVLVTPPEIAPVSLDEAKAQCRADDHNEDDEMIGSLVHAATSHFDGWTGVLGRALCEQTWRQDFDSFAKCLRLPLFPVAEIVSITARNPEGQLSTVASSNYTLQHDALGAYVRFKDSFSFSGSLNQTASVAVTYTAGDLDTPEVEAEPEEEPPVEAVPRASNVPAPIKQAILLLVAYWYDNREAASADAKTSIPFAVDALTAPYRRSRF